jgi:hypothetical protein
MDTKMLVPHSLFPNRIASPTNPKRFYRIGVAVRGRALHVNQFSQNFGIKPLRVFQVAAALLICIGLTELTRAQNTSPQQSSGQGSSTTNKAVGNSSTVRGSATDPSDQSVDPNSCVRVEPGDESAAFVNVCPHTNIEVDVCGVRTMTMPNDIDHKLKNALDWRTARGTLVLYHMGVTGNAASVKFRDNYYDPGTTYQYAYRACLYKRGNMEGAFNCPATCPPDPSALDSLLDDSPNSLDSLLAEQVKTDATAASLDSLLQDQINADAAARQEATARQAAILRQQQAAFRQAAAQQAAAQQAAAQHAAAQEQATSNDQSSSVLSGLINAISGAAMQRYGGASVAPSRAGSGGCTQIPMCGANQVINYATCSCVRAPGSGTPTTPCVLNSNGQCITGVR